MGLLDLLVYYFLIVICRFVIEMQYLTKKMIIGNASWNFIWLLHDFMYKLPDNYYDFNLELGSCPLFLHSTHQKTDSQNLSCKYDMYLLIALLMSMKNCILDVYNHPTSPVS